MNRLTRLLLIITGSAIFAVPATAGDSIRLPLPPLPRLPIIVPEPPLFLLPPALGFRVAVDTPHDLFEVDNRYYAFENKVWFVGPGYNGPWRSIQIDLLPPGLRRHHFREIHRERDREHSRYRKDGKNYHGKTYRPEREQHKDKRSKHRDKDDDKRDREHSDRGKHRGHQDRDHHDD